jgi:peptidoglycan/xylan/chitin deacetylase (PgdA/CDA1 family)
MSKEHQKLVYIVLIFAVMISLSYLKQIPKPKILPPISLPIPILVTTNEISRGSTDKKQVIFTFDGGSGNQSTIEILNVLEKHKSKGTFFLTGMWVIANSELVNMIHEKGHEIYSHTYSHPHLTEISDEGIRDELRKMDNELYRVIGKQSKPFFRPPFGDRDERVLKIAAEEGYQSIYWSTDALDWLETEGETNESVINRIMTNLKPGEIYLMHLGDNITGQILDRVLDNVELQGYRAVSLTEGI